MYSSSVKATTLIQMLHIATKSAYHRSYKLACNLLRIESVHFHLYMKKKTLAALKS